MVNKEKYISDVIEQLAKGEGQTVDAEYFRLDEIRQMASATVWKGKGTLTVTNTEKFTQNDKDSATASPGGGDDGENAKIRFV